MVTADEENKFESPGVPGPVKLEAEQYGDANFFDNKQNTDGRYSGNRALEVNWEYWDKIQLIEDMAAGFDTTKTPFVRFVIDAEKDGEYTIQIRFRNVPYDFPEGLEKNPTVVMFVNDGAPEKLTITTPAGGSWDDTMSITVNLSKGRNILRFTSMTKDFIDYIKQHATRNNSNFYLGLDYIIIPEGLYGVEPQKVEIAAKSAKYYKNMTPSNENQDFWGLKYDYVGEITPYTLTLRDISFVPYFSMTFTAPIDGYYNIAPILRYSSRGPVELGILVDGVIPKKRPVYPSTDSTTVTDREPEFNLYLTQGNHIITFTGLMAPDENVVVKTTNFYTVIMRGGLEFAQEQEDPMNNDTNFIRIEAEEYGDWVESKLYTGTRQTGYSGGRAVEVYNYDAQNIQTLEDMKTKFDKYKTPYIQYTVDASKAGQYIIYPGIRFIGFIPNRNPDIAVMVNDGHPVKVTLQGEKGGDSKPTRLVVDLNEGKNTIRLTTYTREFVDEVKRRAKEGESGIENSNNFYIAFDYLDIPKELTPVLTGVRNPDIHILEAETHGLGNLFKRGSASSGIYSGGSGNGDSRMNYTQTLENIRKNGLDYRKTPFTVFTVYAPEDGEYEVISRIRCGIYGSNASAIYGMMAHFVLLANDDIQNMKVFDFPILEDKKDWFIRESAKLKLKKGENRIYLTALTADLTDSNGKSVLWNEVEEAFLWLDHDYIAVPKSVTCEPVGGRIEAEYSLYAYYTNNLFSTSGGFVGLRDEGNTRNSINYNITFDNLNYDNMSLIHMVHYKAEAPEDGWYDVTIAIRAVDTVGSPDVNPDDVIGYLAVMVNYTDKYKVEFHLGYRAVYTRIKLKKGINTISVSGTVREMLESSMEPVGVSLRIDQDFIDLGSRLTIYDEGRHNSGENDDIATPLSAVKNNGQNNPDNDDSDPNEDKNDNDDGGKPVNTGYPAVAPAGLGLSAVSGATLAASLKRRKRGNKCK